MLPIKDRRKLYIISKISVNSSSPFGNNCFFILEMLVHAGLENSMIIHYPIFHIFSTKFGVFALNRIVLFSSWFLKVATGLMSSLVPCLCVDLI